ARTALLIGRMGIRRTGVFKPLCDPRLFCTICTMSDPLISIIMRSFNEAWALRETLPALQAQEYKNWELIVIDSGSTDGSQGLLRSAQPRHFIQISPHEYNPAWVMNYGMKLARSEFGIFLNADATP